MFKTSYVRLRKQRKRLATAGVASLVVASLLLPVLQFGTAQAATAVLLPNSDVTTQWSLCNNTTCGAARYTYIDEDASGSYTGSDYINTGPTGSSDASAAVEFGMTTASNVDTVSSITVYIYAYSATNANGGTLDNIDIDLRINGGLQGAITRTPAYSAGGTYSQYSAVFNGSWSQANLDGAQILVTRSTQGSGNPTNQRDDVRIGSLSATAEFTQTVTFDQSSYRWFENEDVDMTTFAEAWGGTGIDRVYALALDTSGNIYVAGSTASTGLTAGSDDQTLVKYNSSGVEQWSKTWGGTGSDIAYALALDASGNIYVVGSTNSTTLNISGTASDTDQTLVKYNSSGVEQWSKIWGGTGSDIARALVLDTSGNIYVSGETSSPGFAIGFADQTLVKYNSSGVEQWSKTWGGTGADIANDIALDSSGNIYVVGYTNSSGLSSETTYSDQTLVKYDSSGAEQWSKSWGGNSNDVANALVLDESGNIYVAGSTASTGLTAGNADQTLVKYNSSGVEQWSKTWGGSNSEFARDLVLDSLGNIYVVGETWSTGLTAGGGDQNLVKYDSSGVEQWSKTWGGTGNDIAYALALDPSGNIYVAGRTASTGFTAGSDDQSFLKFDSSGQIYNCSECVDRTTSETDRTTSETDRTTSETDRTTSETDRTTSETDRTGDATITTVCELSNNDESLAALNTAADAPAEGTPFRLRMNLHVGIAEAEAGVASFKLQYAARGADNVCDTSFTNETYADVSPSSGVIRFYDNTNAVDGQPLATNANDPTHSTDDLVRQSYEESNNFTVANAIPAGDDGMWDFALVDFNAPASTVYCFRAVTSAGAVLNSYAVVPQITTASSTLSQASFRAYENKSPDIPYFIKGWGGTGSDFANDIALDPSGNIYVAGRAMSSVLSSETTYGDQTLVKYNSSGEEQWTKTWGGDGTDIAHALVLDDTGNIYVAGETASAGLAVGGTDQTLVKYNSSGVEQWSKTWGGDDNDYANAIALDPSGNIYVVGYTDSSSLNAGAYDQTLVKYNSSGVEQWSKTWGGIGTDTARDIALDPSNNIYVIGASSTPVFTAGGTDQTLVKYNSSGVEQWSKTWGGTGAEVAYALALDSASNIYVVGSTASTGLTAGSDDQTLWRTATDEGGCVDPCVLRDTLEEDRTGDATMEFRTITEEDRTTSEVDRTVTEVDRTGVATITEIYVPETFATAWGGTGQEIAHAVAVDTSGNIYVAGSTASTGLTAGSHDQTLVKYNSSGEEQWSKTWGGAGADIAYALALDASGNIYVAGATASTGLTAGSYDQTLVKYNSSGVEQWSKTWGGDGIDFAFALTLDPSGNIYVAGYTFSTGLTSGGYDQTLVKYNSSGVEQWSKTWGDSAGSEVAYALALDSAGNIYVAGYTSSAGLTAGSNDQTLVKYNSSGVEQWSKTWGGTGVDIARALALDSSGNIYVAGQTASSGLTADSSDQTLVKYNSSGVEQWSKTWDHGESDAANALALDDSGNIYVAGQTGFFGDQTLVKYNSSGVEQWSKTWGGDDSDIANALALDTSGNIYVAGQTNTFGLTAGDDDQTLLKFDQYGDIHGCGTLCRDRVSAVIGNHTDIAVDRTTAETDRTTAETDRTTAETDTTGDATITTAVAATPIKYLYNGTALAAVDARAELLEIDMTFRLRIGIHADGKKYTSAGTFKLQSGVYTGTCDPSTTSYADVSGATSPIAFYDNDFSVDEAYIHPDADDPTYLTDRARMQSYIETNTFSNPRELRLDDLAIWDFALKADGLNIGRTHCFRMVESGNSLNGGYTQYAEVYIPPSMGSVMRHGKFFNTRGTAQPFAWGRQ